MRGTPKLVLAILVIFGIIVVATFVPEINQTITTWLGIIFHKT